MTSIHEATPSQFEAMRNRKARLDRIAAKAYRPPEVIALAPIDEPDPTPASAVHVVWFEDRRITVEHVKAAVAKDFGLTPIHLESDRRQHQIVVARQTAIYLAKELTPRSLSYIASRFGGRDHSTAVHAVKKTAQRIATDPAFAARVAAIKESIGA